MLRLFASLFSALIGISWMAAAPTLAGEPRLAFVRSGQPLRFEEMLILDPVRERVRLVARGSWGKPFPGDGFSWAPDGSRFAFGWLSFTDVKASLFQRRVDGGPARPLPGTRGGFAPVFARDGGIAFARLRFRAPGVRPKLSVATSIWLRPVGQRRSRRLMPQRWGAVLAPAAFSPDGADLILDRKRSGRAHEVVAVNLANGTESILAQGAEPAYSPDGTEIAFVRWWKSNRLKRRRPLSRPGGDLFVAAADGSAVRRLTFSPERQELSPSWDPSGERLAFAQEPPPRQGPARFSEPGSAIFEINADGTCGHRLLITHGITYSEPAWQPGQGRGAGRIRC